MNNTFSKIDLNLLQIFEAIYAEGNITRAADKLNMSQPRVSHSLNRLRNQLDDQLFVRSEKGVTPTPFAQRLITPVRRALSILRVGVSAKESSEISDSSRTIPIICNEFAAEIVLPNILGVVALKAPHIKLIISSQNQQSSAQRLLSGEVDIVVDIVVERLEGIDAVTLQLPPPKLIARRDHPRIQGSITKEQFSSERHIVMSQNKEMRRKVDSMLDYVGVERDIICEFKNPLMMHPIVASTDFLALMPSFSALRASQHYDLQVLPLPFEFPNPTLNFAIRSESSGDAVIEWLSQLFLEQFERH